MRTWIVALGSCALVLLGCSLGAGRPEATPTAEASPAEPPTAAPTPIALPEAAPTEPTQTQEPLVEGWRGTIENGILLQTACILMFETHAAYRGGEIDLDRARAELGSEDGFVAFVWSEMTSGPVPSDAAAPFMLELEEKVSALFGLPDPADAESIGSPEVLDTLTVTCSSLEALVPEMVDAGLEAGLTLESVDAIDQGLTEIINDWYTLTVWGR